MSRPLTVTQKHNGVTVPGAVTTTAYPGVDRTDVTGPAGNGTGPVSATSTFTDVRGRTTALWTYHNSPLSPTGNRADADVTTYGFTYNPHGSPGSTSTVTDATGKNTWTTTISDLAGHSVATTDPDTGVSTSFSDDAGLLMDTADGRGHLLAYTYDALGRKTAEFDGGTIADRGTLPNAYAGAVANSANQLAKWTYDPAGNNGQPDVSIRYVGGAAGTPYTQQVTGYDVDYRPLGSKTIIPPAEGALAGTYQTNNYYTAMTGLVDHYDTPAVPNAGLGAETIYNSYNQYGLLLSTGGNADYLAATQYDHDGKILSRTVGDYPFQVVQQNLYDAATNRVSNTFLDATAGMSTVDPSQVNSYTVDGVSYTYDAAGRLTSAADLQNWSVSGSYNPGPSQRDLQCYTYDYANRLTNAWTDAGDQTPPATTNPSSPTTATGALGSCASSTTNNAPTATSAATQIGGPAPYWQSYGFDTTGAAGLGNGALTGNRSTVVDHDPAGNTAKDTTRTSAYPAAGTANTAGSNATTGTGPHLLGQVATTGGTTATDTYNYDGAGNTTTRTLAAGPHQTLTWNPEGRLDTVTDTSGGTTKTANYLYDADGNQLIRRDTGAGNAGVTLFLGATEVHLTGTGTVTANRYYDYPAAPSIVADATGAITYEISNSQGSGATTINAGTGQIAARRYFKPYGDQRTTGTTITFGTFPDDHTFLGKTTDTATGLVDVGARKYDPTTGRFISADPLFQAGNPQSIGGYVYADDDPVNGADPTGLANEFQHYGPTGDDTGTDAPISVQHSSQVGSQPAKGHKPSKTWLNSMRSNHNYNYSGSDDFTWDDAYQFAAQSENDWDYVCSMVIGGSPGACSYDPFTGDNIGEPSTKDSFIAWGVAVGAPAAVGLCLLGGCAVAADAGEACAAAASLCAARVATAAAGLADGFFSGGAMAATGAFGGGAALAAAAEDTAGSDASVGTRMVADAGCHSFSGETKVLMADGTTEPIADVKVGDEVENAQPDGRDEKHRVDQVHVTRTDQDFTDLTIATPTGPHTVTGTQNHPYWDATDGKFTDASQLRPGDRLQTTGNDVATVLAVRNYRSSMITYDLTIDGLHTYYVVAGDTPVLVHNTSCGPSFNSDMSAWRHYMDHVFGVPFNAKGNYTGMKAWQVPDLPEFNGANGFAEYKQAASDFLSGGPKRGDLVTDAGSIIRIDAQTGYFGVLDNRGVIQTFFRPDGDLTAYFAEQQRLYRGSIVP
ncbi:RHS repeat-associated protein [Catenulispora sp. EB89]|uniref:RHS repeat-associated core domain-containing protein n=1 Tax=Catenulispora sp. EB89 TaxID=3156257 RepID=UPI003516EB74